MEVSFTEEHLAYARTMLKGTFTDFNGITISLDENQGLQLSVDVQPHHLNPNGTVHGGMIYTLLDTAAGCYARGVRGFKGFETTQSGTIYYIRPGITKRLYTRCEIIHCGRTTCLVHVDILDDDDRLIAYGESSLFHIEPAQK